MLQQLLRSYFSTANPPLQTVRVAARQTLLEKLQKVQQIVLTKDGYQVNIGLLIERRPILLKANRVDMEGIKAHYQLKKKYGLIPTISKETFEYDWIRPNFGVDEIPTHMRVDKATEEKSFYYGNSKFYEHVDVNVKDPSSIQYMPCYHTYYMVKKANSEEWEFPWMSIPDQYSFAEAREELFRKLSDDSKWNIHFISLNPVVVHRKETPPTKALQRIKGSKTFYFLATHVDGNPKPYGDWDGQVNWVPRGYFNKYVDKDTYRQFVGILQI